MRTVIRLAALAASVVFAGSGLAACGSSAPSAQCRAQVAQIAAYQADARAISDSGAVFSSSLYSQYQADMGASGRLLAQVKAEGCPSSGYKGGYSLG